MKAIITGATGMVGEGVLLECLSSPAVEKVLVINRRSGGVSHPKLQEIIHTENALIRLFENSYMFRPGFMKPSPGQRNVKSHYKYILWLYPIRRALYPTGFCTLREVALAMTKVASTGYSKHSPGAVFPAP